MAYVGVPEDTDNEEALRPQYGINNTDFSNLTQSQMHGPTGVLADLSSPNKVQIDKL